MQAAPILHCFLDAIIQLSHVAPAPISRFERLTRTSSSIFSWRVRTDQPTAQPLRSLARVATRVVRDRLHHGQGERMATTITLSFFILMFIYHQLLPFLLLQHPHQISTCSVLMTCKHLACPPFPAAFSHFCSASPHSLGLQLACDPTQQTFSFVFAPLISYVRAPLHSRVHANNHELPFFVFVYKHTGHFTKSVSSYTHARFFICLGSIVMCTNTSPQSRHSLFVFLRFCFLFFFIHKQYVNTPLLSPAHSHSTLLLPIIIIISFAF